MYKINVNCIKTFSKF